MVNKNLFKTSVASQQPATDTTNLAGGKAYSKSDKAALAQLACTNCFNGTYYSSAEALLEKSKEAILALKGDPLFLAKTAVYAHTVAKMKDMPAFIVTWLAGLDTVLFRKAFRKVVTNGKMLRNVLQLARSGECGRRFNVSAGTWRAAVQEWFDNRSYPAIFKASIGNDPSMRDILRMTRPAPRDRLGQKDLQKEALFGYMLGKDEVNFEALPLIVREYERYKRKETTEVPDVDFRFLDSLQLDTAAWKQVARKANWYMTRMNLNTFLRQGVFGRKTGLALPDGVHADDHEMVDLIAARLRDPVQIAQANAFPYQLLMAFLNATEVPAKVRDALQDAMELATANIPTMPGDGYICVDVSGSMSSPVTGNRGTATSKARCVDVAALIGSCFLRKNPGSAILPFEHDVKPIRLNSRDSVMTNAQKLAAIGGGGTNCSAPLALLNANRLKGRWVVFVSDNESWVDSGWGGRSTAMQAEWANFKSHNPGARMVCIDLTPNTHSQVVQRPDILQIGGFSDQVFNVVHSFLEHGHEADHWTATIDSVSLEEVSEATEEEEPVAG